MSTLEKAIAIALKAHAGQRDRSGQPYIGHVLRVMSMGSSNEEKICGVLHDVVEDSEITFEDLRQEGFSSGIVSALECLTKIAPDEDYDLFTERISKNLLAVKVKLNDLADNMDIRRLGKVENHDIHRLNKYLKAYRKLSELLNKQF